MDMPYEPFFKDCGEEKNQNSLESNVKYEIINGHTFIKSPDGITTIIPYLGGGYDGPDY